MNALEREEERRWVETAAISAPALIGAAAGVVLGDVMHSRMRKPVAISLAAIGLAALAPLVGTVVVDKVKGPTTRRGSQRTLRSIRDGGGYDLDEIELADEELGIG